jgi:hypothetical protein
MPPRWLLARGWPARWRIGIWPLAAVAGAWLM